MRLKFRESLRAYCAPFAALVLANCAGEPVRHHSSVDVGAQEAPASRTSNTADRRIHLTSAPDAAVVSVALPPPSKEDEPSFCKLNPGACPEPLAEPEPGESAAGNPWKYFACVQACNSGGEAMDQFCRSLPGSTKRQKQIQALCWGVSRGSRIACLVFCEAYFGRPRPSNP